MLKLSELISMSSRKAISASVKNAIAAKQQHKCATVEGYICPFQGKTFDESGFQIDHFIEIADSGTNDMDNLQALCPCCHSFKTLRSARERASKPKEGKKTSTPKRKIDYIKLSKILTSNNTVNDCEIQIRNMLLWEEPDYTDSKKFENRYVQYDQLIPYLKLKGVPYTISLHDSVNRMQNNFVDKIQVDLEAFIKSLPNEFTVVRPK